MNLLSSSPALQALAILVAGFIFFRAYKAVILSKKRAAFAREHGCLPGTSYPQLDPIYGLDFLWDNIKYRREKTLLEHGHQRFKQTGLRTMHQKLLGNTILSTIEPENLKTIQAVDFKKWGLTERRKTAFEPLLGNGIFASDGPPWKHSRDMLRPSFARSQVGDLPTFEHHVAILISSIPRDGSMVDLSDLFFRLTMDSATEFLFGESTNSLTKGGSEGFSEAFTRSQDHIANESRFGFWNRFMRETGREKDRKFVHDFVDSYVDNSMAKRSQLVAAEKEGETKRYVFLDEMVRQGTDRVQIRFELLNILLAGRDTTASLLSNVWFTLSKRPDIFVRLQSEIAALNGKVPTLEELRSLKYLRALLNESLRLYPVVATNSREPYEDTTLPLGGGPDGSAPLFVPKGQMVAWSVYSMHRRTDFYGADAEEFRPERWLDNPATGEKGLRPGWEYLPFNGGARICLGQQYALTEASYTTIRLCQAFSGLESRDPEPWREGITITCTNAGGCKVALTPREG